MDDRERRTAATERIEEKRDFRRNLVGCLVINQFLVGVWALSGGRSFWPGWVMLGWSVGLVLHGSYTYRGYRPISEDVIRPEMGGSG